MDQFKEHIIKLLKKETKLSDINLEIPPSSELGDYAFPCFVLSKKYKKNPNEVAQELTKKIKLDKTIKEVKATGPYLNFFVNKEKLSEDVLRKISNEKEKYGIQPKTNKTILVEYPGPNTNKPLHLGHVRNISLGYSLCNLLKANGHNVVVVNINNDRGIQICKSMLAYKKWGKNDSPETQENKKFSGHRKSKGFSSESKLKSDHFVGKYYVMFAKKSKENPKLEDEAKELLKKWEKRDKETIELWKKMNKWALDGFKETYKKFDIKFQKEYFESSTYKKGKEIILDGLKKRVFKKDEDGAVFVDLNKQGYGNKILLRADGTSVYITQDIYLAKERYKDFKYDKSIYVVATEQIYHFKVLFETLKILKFPFADKCYHFAYGMVNLTTGKMKSREGSVVDADDLVNDMIKLALKETKSRNKDIDEKELKKRAEKIAMGAIRFYILKYDSTKDFTFNPKESISFEGETGPYLQYTYARINSILKKYNKKIENKADTSLLKEKEELELITTLSNFNDVVKTAGKNYKIHTITRYLLDLAQAFNNFYHTYPVLKADEELKKARLLLISCVKQVIKNGLNLLGIDVLKRM
ncbi:arginine--tRNA ligase [Candidatus Woesearchaeota archaeon B3_Woes]|nr:MAG: arginine--tRNA ligase [Candidatus Woesearchaeota archaeon B3_Woes]